MNTQSLTFGIVGFLLGGLVVSIAATQLNNSSIDHSGDMTMTQMTEDLKNKSGDDFDEAFISSMLAHHEGAVEMAKLSASRAKHSEIKQLSQEIISAQESEMAQMKQWQKEWNYETATHSTH